MDESPTPDNPSQGAQFAHVSIELAIALDEWKNAGADPLAVVAAIQLFIHAITRSDMLSLCEEHRMWTLKLPYCAVCRCHELETRAALAEAQLEPMRLLVSKILVWSAMPDGDALSERGQRLSEHKKAREAEVLKIATELEGA